MPLHPFLLSIVGFLRAGYPEGAPAQDHQPLFALLARRLSEEEVVVVADELASAGDPVTARAILERIATTTGQDALDADLMRVSARLAAAGWPLAAPGKA